MYLPPSFSLDPKSVDDAIRSNQYKNMQIIMPLDFVFFNYKMQVEDLFRSKDHGIQDYLGHEVIAEKEKSFFAFSLNEKFGCPMIMYHMNYEKTELMDLWAHVSNITK